MTSDKSIDEPGISELKMALLIGAEEGTYEICHEWDCTEDEIENYANFNRRGKFLRKDKDTGFTYFEFLPTVPEDIDNALNVKPPSAMDLLEKKIDEHRDAIVKLQNDRDAVNAMTLVECIKTNYGDGCGAKTQIKELTYIRTHWYTSPSGCTEGDYWNVGEGQWDCPECGHRNRICDVWGQENMEEIRKLSHLFKDVEDTYKDD